MSIERNQLIVFIRPSRSGTVGDHPSTAFAFEMSA